MAARKKVVKKAAKKPRVRKPRTLADRVKRLERAEARHAERMVLSDYLDLGGDVEDPADYAEYYKRLERVGRFSRDMDRLKGGLNGLAELRREVKRLLADVEKLRKEVWVAARERDLRLVSGK